MPRDLGYSFIVSPTQVLLPKHGLNGVEETDTMREVE